MQPGAVLFRQPQAGLDWLRQIVTDPAVLACQDEEKSSGKLKILRLTQIAGLSRVIL
jgi:hypothetical protein